ncbi:MAG TPA: hypothetical protein VNP96_12140 [Solirubrobacterales bacterium]|nr:hypothetical protein [Solirubrobacterales bacterium]
MNHANDIGQIQENLRAVSKQVFSKQYRLEIAAVCSAQEPPTWSRRLATTLGIAENQVASEIGSFARLGALQRFPAEHDRRKVYQVVPHPLWGFARELLEDTIRATELARAEDSVARYWAAILGEAAPWPVPG